MNAVQVLLTAVACQAGPYSISKMVMSTTCWPVLMVCILCFLLSWGASLLLYVQLGSYKLALCTSMHMASGILMGLWTMLHRCPLAPVFRPGLVAGGVATGMAMLLMCISHVYYAIPFDSLEFYMCHLWAVAVCCPLVQQVGMGLVVLRLFAPSSKGELLLLAAAGDAGEHDGDEEDY